MKVNRSRQRFVEDVLASTASSYDKNRARRMEKNQTWYLRFVGTEALTNEKKSAARAKKYPALAKYTSPNTVQYVRQSVHWLGGGQGG